MDIKKLFNDVKNDHKIDSDFIKYLLWRSPSTQSYLKQNRVRLWLKNLGFIKNI